jgi:hypothetical protein
LCALVLGLGSAPALAACPSLDNLAQYSGAAQLIYVASKVSVSDGNGGLENLSMDHHGSDRNVARIV